MRSDHFKRHEKSCGANRKHGGIRKKNQKISESEILTDTTKTKKSAPKKDTADRELAIYLR